jgi:cyclopropane fatty-acyl-phospholipid synthase-like methyltransferase
MQALHLRPDDRVPDPPCGAGRVAVHLAKAGCRVSGIDRNPRFVARAQQRCNDAGVLGEFRTLDMRQLDVDRSMIWRCMACCTRIGGKEAFPLPADRR